VACVLTVKELKAGYGLSQALDGLDVEIPDGQFVAILGRNGMGKTSLCRAIMSLSPPTVWAGSIQYEGDELTRLSPHEVAKAGLGYVPQGRRIFGSLSVIENLTVVARQPGNGRDGGWDLERIWEMFPRLYERRANRAEQLSGGEQQMLAIGRALMSNPSVLIMDEPSEGLAPLIVEAVREQLVGLKQEAQSVLMVEQNYTLALDLADVVYVIENGRVVFHGAPAELDADDEVKRRHLGVGV
jgi:branched-chain amino acid transport system ATP-binding protein